MRNAIARFALSLVTIVFGGTSPAAAQDHGGGGAGCGDLFGDLVHVLRHPETGAPILQKRWVAGPMDVYDWAYCPIALDAAGQPLSFLPYSCDVDPASGTAVAVDYFGRLSGGRTKERNIRMHFDEVIDKIKGAFAVSRDASGRLALCVSVGSDGVCLEWDVVDSPPENLALYTRLMKYGHLQTDPLEEDLWAHGDPTMPTQYHPALDGADHAKFAPGLRSLLPGTASCPTLGEATCFAPEALEQGDFLAAASLLGTAADKTGYATVDLVHYLNRILKIPVATPASAATHDVVHPWIRDCGDARPDPVAEPLAPGYQPGTPGCTDVAVTAETVAAYPAPANEAFVDFRAFAYERASHFNFTVEALRPADTLGLPRLAALEALLGHAAEDVWVVEPAIPLLDWLLVRNAEGGASGPSVHGFVKATNDALRSVEFVHNYAVPAYLGWDFGLQ